MSYAASSLNQYSSITRPNAVEITGVTFADVPTVKVNGQPATGRPPGNGEPGGFAQWLEGIAGDSLPNGQWPEVTLEFKKPGAGMQGHDLQHTRTGHVYVRPSETPQYDDDGNLIQDAGWTYTWDAENRLIAAEMRDVSVPASVDLRRVEFSYDAKGRRFERRLKVKATPTGSTVRNTAWQEVSHVHYWYDGWNLAAETDDSGSVHQYIWGTDLSGTLQGAGGVGGLLGVATAGRMYAVCTEVNGNVMGLVDGQSGQLVARWDYDPFGNLVTDWYAPGATSATCPIRFSSKALDPDLGWYYYGYRYYAPESGRWAARDPIGARGGLNLYGMVGNNPGTYVDIIGLFSSSVHQSITQSALSGDADVSRCVKDIVAANVAMDDGAVAGVFGFRSNKFFNPLNHGDDNRISETIELLQNRIKTMAQKKCSSTQDIDAIISTTGAVLHAVQDLYAHSTYVEEMQQQFGAEPLPEWELTNASGEPQVPAGVISGNYQYPRDNGLPPTHYDLNKDKPGSNSGKLPSAGGDSTLHQRAVDLATSHSKQMWEQIKRSLDPTCLCQLKKRCQTKP